MNIDDSREMSESEFRDWVMTELVRAYMASMDAMLLGDPRGVLPDYPPWTCRRGVWVQW